MHGSVAAKITSSAIPSIVCPGRLAINPITRDFKRSARYIGRCQKIDQMWVDCRTMWIVAVDTGIIVIKHMQAMGERVISVQAANIVTLETEAVRKLIEAGLRIKFIPQCHYALKA